MNDNQYITKADLKTFGKELVSSLEQTLEQKLEQKLEVRLSSMEKRLQKNIAETGAHYYGLIHEDLKSTFLANKQWLIGVPERVSKLNEQAEENEYEHKEFKMRLGVLERR